MSTPAGEREEAGGGYRFGPRDQRGLVAGVRTGQAGVLAASLVLAVLTAHALRGLAAVPVAGLVAVAGAGLAFVPLAGRTLEQWLPVLARHAATGLVGGRRHPAEPDLAPARRRTARPFRDLRVVAVAAAQAGAPAGEPFGAVEDRRMRTLTGVLRVAGTSFALADRDDQAGRVAAWSSVLAALAGEEGSVVRLQWVERTVPAEAPRRPGGLGWPEASPAARSYRTLLRDEPGRLRHEQLVAVSVRAPRSASRRSPRPGRHGRARDARGAGQDVGALLGRALAGLERRLVEAGLSVEGALSQPGLCDALRRGFEPGPRQGPPPRTPWPARLEVGWSRARVGGVVQRTYWIAEWPRSEVAADFLVPLVLAGEERRTLSLVMAPVPAGAAVRAAEHARTSSVADAELRARHGFAVSARTRRQQDAVLQREAELAAGHAAFRFSGYLGVAAPDEAALARACARLEQAAALARLSLRRLDGCQDEALAVCLPVGRGCS